MKINVAEAEPFGGINSGVEGEEEGVGQALCP